jgi:prophage DNA circulation protein
MSEQQAASVSSSVTTTTPTVNKLMPEFITEAAATVTTVFRTTRKVAEGIERTVDGVDEIATLMLSQQRQRLLNEYKAIPTSA